VEKLSGRSVQKSLTTSQPSSNDQLNLKGLRLVVTDLDLQQREHRGIAVYSKAVLKALKASGAETWLLTDFDPNMSDPGLRRLPACTQGVVYAARVMEALVSGHAGLRSKYWDEKLRRFHYLAHLRRLLLRIQTLIRQSIPRQYQLSKLMQVDLHDQYDSPYLHHERLSYFENLDGIICAPNLYLNATRRALGRKPKPLAIELGNGFDGLITTCPLNLSILDKGCFIQTVHDLIPLEYVQHLDHVALFCQRLSSAVPARKLFVSTASRQKFERAFQNSQDPGGAVVAQPPSLRLPTGSEQRLFAQSVLRPSKRAKAHHSELEPFRYLLFNSSVEPRKNLLFAIKAFRLSRLADQGIRLCVTGMLKGDAYSKAVGEQADDSVLLTDYIDEATKANLFLHAMMILSPSLVEGFGIPVMDGACVGAPVIASPTEAHREIKTMHDFWDLVWLCETLDPMTWALAMHDLAQAELARILDVADERQRRLERYALTSKALFDSFQHTICELVLTGVRSGMAGSGVRD
jgi:glycosyltransferase involved in cell wall biosynthesis